MAPQPEALEGSIDRLWFHYDLRNDVLYLRRLEDRSVASHGEETDDGVILLRALDDDRVLGLTVVDWWKRFGGGQVPDSMKQITGKVEPWAGRLNAAA